MQLLNFAYKKLHNLHFSTNKFRKSYYNKKNQKF